MRQCDKYYNGSQILICQMSKTFTLFTVYFKHTIPSDYRCSARIRLRVRIRDRSAGDWKCLSVNPAVDVAFSFLSYMEEGGSKEREFGSVFHMLCPRYIGPLTPTAPLQPLGYAGSRDLYLSRRRRNSRFLCTQLFNTTLSSLLNN